MKMIAIEAKAELKVYLQATYIVTTLERHKHYQINFKTITLFYSVPILFYSIP